MPDVTTPDAFDPIFRQGVSIIGGHAVNLWAAYYAERGDKELREFEPFTSKDGDIYLKDPDLAQAIAAAAGWRFVKNPEPRSAVVGMIVMEKAGKVLEIHVMRVVNGLSDADLAKTEELTLKDGTVYCVPAPATMLKSKLSNLDSINQKDGQRQDERHARIMIPCVRHYLADTLEAVRMGTIPEREAVDRFMEAHRITTTAKAQQLDRAHNLKLVAAIPNREVLGNLSELPRLCAFYEHQIQRIGPKLGI